VLWSPDFAVRAISFTALAIAMGILVVVWPRVPPRGELTYCALVGWRAFFLWYSSANSPVTEAGAPSLNHTIIDSIGGAQVPRKQPTEP